jgi:hypothetical protein
VKVFKAPTSADAKAVELAITGGTDSASFELTYDNTSDEYTLEFTSSTTIDYESKTSYEVQLTARYAESAGHSQGNPITATVTVNITDVADTDITWDSTEAPSNAVNPSVNENAALSFDLESLIDSFDDAVNKSDLVYQITGGADSGDFAISGHTLSWDTGSTGKDYEDQTSYVVKVRARYATDQTANQSPELTVTVSLNDVADVAPTIAGGDDTYTIESGTANNSLFTLTGTSDTGNSVTWTSSNSNFTITSGNVNSGTAATVGYGGAVITASSVTVTFTCKDSVETTLQSTKQVTITVTQPASDP